MRRFGPVVVLGVLLACTPCFADPAPREAQRRPAAEDGDRLRLGARPEWSTAGLGRRFGLGLSWRLPQRWYDADGQLLTERSLLSPGEDLERSGLYLAVRF
jgi:hypothetical protein